MKADAAPTGAGAHKGPSLFVRAGRCGECHERFRSEWTASAHAKATRSAAFRKSLAAVGETPGNTGLRDACMGCHLPSLPYGQPDEAPGNPSEGVSCDGCHTLSAIKVEAKSATMTFDPASGKKYGPIVGATGHYFHDMAYSAAHAKSEICAGCHHMTALAAGGKVREVPVVLDYADWQRVGKGKPCQDCHMPSRGTEPVARGAKPRPDVPSHGFPGAVTLGAKGTQLSAAPRGKPGEIAVTIQHSAGHMLPSGFVDRRLVLRAEYKAADGQTVFAEDRVFGVFLVDEAGQPAPFFRAARIKSERRIAPGKPYVEVFQLPQPGVPGVSVTAAPAKAVFSLLSAATAPELRAVYGEPELTVIKSVSLNLPQRSGGKQ